MTFLKKKKRHILVVQTCMLQHHPLLTLVQADNAANRAYFMWVWKVTQCTRYGNGAEMVPNTGFHTRHCCSIWLVIKSRLTSQDVSRINHNIWISVGSRLFVVHSSCVHHFMQDGGNIVTSSTNWQFLCTAITNLTNIRPTPKKSHILWLRLGHYSGSGFSFCCSGTILELQWARQTPS